MKAQRGNFDLTRNGKREILSNGGVLNREWSASPRRTGSVGLRIVIRCTYCPERQGRAFNSVMPSLL